MKILALDTAAAACSVALLENKNPLAYQFEEMNRGHASALVPMVDRVVKEAGLSFEEIDVFGVTIGPGAFTGLRIALSTARAFGLAHQKPVIGVTTLEALAFQANEQNCEKMTIVAALDAKRADIYAQSFSSDLEMHQDPMAALPEDLAQNLDCIGQDILITGDSFDRIAPVFEKNGCHIIQSPYKFPDAQFVALKTFEKIQNGEKTIARPLYIRPPDAALPKNGGRLRP